LKLLIDEHYPPSVAEQLRERGHDAVSAQEEADLRGMTDPDLFAEAQRRNRAVLTENVADYMALDAEYRGRNLVHWGLVLTSNRTFPRGKTTTVGALVNALDELLRKEDSDDRSSKVIWLQRSK
jgi:predicted nuclease of predicted toxin-antitoxin system